MLNPGLAAGIFRRLDKNRQPALSTIDGTFDVAAIRMDGTAGDAPCISALLDEVEATRNRIRHRRRNAVVDRPATVAAE